MANPSLYKKTVMLLVNPKLGGKEFHVFPVGISLKVNVRV